MSYRTTRGALVYGIRVEPQSYLLSQETRLRISINVVNKSKNEKTEHHKKFSPMIEATVNINERIQKESVPYFPVSFRRSNPFNFRFQPPPLSPHVP
jgi:hypothetical protein